MTLEKTEKFLLTRFAVAILLACGISGTASAQYPVADAAAIRESQIYESRRSVFTQGPGTASDGVRVVVTSAAVPRMSKEASARLKVADGDRTAFTDFLRTPNTGIFRLIGLPDCSGPFKDRADEQKCYFESYSVSLLANSFSFRAKRHDRQIVADLTLRKDSFISLPSFALSFITALGDVPISDISLGSAGVGYVSAFEPSLVVDKAAEQVAIFDKVTKDGKYAYSRRIRIVKNITYLMRSCGYKVSKELPAGPAEDVIVAFRVIRIDDNGDVTIIWKELQRKKGQKLELNEKK